LESELLFRLSEPFIHELMKFNGHRVNGTNKKQLELICKIESITRCPIVMVSPLDGMFICLDLLRVRPIVLKETYQLRYLYSDNSKLKTYNDEDYFYSVPVKMNEKFDLYDGLKIKLYTENNSFKPYNSYLNNMDKIVLMLTTYDKQLEHSRGSQHVGRGNTITTWSEDQFCLGNEYISTKTANLYIKLVKKSIENIQTKLYRNKDTKFRTCRSKHMIKNLEDHIFQKSQENTIVQISKKLYTLKYVGMEKNNIKLFVFFENALSDIKKIVSDIELYTKKEIKYYSEEDDIIEKENILKELLMILYTDISDTEIQYYMQYLYQVDLPKYLYRIRNDIKKIKKKE